MKRNGNPQLIDQGNRYLVGGKKEEEEKNKNYYFCICFEIIYSITEKSYYNKLELLLFIVSSSWGLVLNTLHRKIIVRAFCRCN